MDDELVNKVKASYKTQAVKDKIAEYKGGYLDSKEAEEIELLVVDAVKQESIDVAHVLKEHILNEMSDTPERGRLVDLIANTHNAIVGEDQKEVKD